MVRNCFDVTFLERWKKILGIKGKCLCSRQHCKKNHAGACLPLHGLVCWSPVDKTGVDCSRKRRRICKQQQHTTLSLDFKIFPIAVHLLNDLIEHKDNKGDFTKRVSLFDEAEYLKLCPRPIYLNKIKEILYNGKYADMNAFVSDVRRVFQNAIVFNRNNAYFCNRAKTLLSVCEAKYAASVVAFRQLISTHATHKCNHCRGKKCGLCGYKCLHFKEIKLRCSKRDNSNNSSESPQRQGGCGRLIDKGSPFFRTGDRGQYWCKDCHQSLPNEFVGISGGVVRKASLERGLFTLSTIEPWVSCSGCTQWFHRICVQHIGDGPYHCEACTKAMVSRPQVMSSAALLARLAETPLTRFIHQRITARLVVADSEHGVSVASSLHVRLVSCRDRVGKMDARLSAWIRSLSPSNPVEFPYRSKAIALFQNIEGSPVLLFVMYVHEYNHKCPAPNSRTAYLAYIDSVCLMRPRRFRSAVYQAMVAGYSGAIKRRGFHKLYIWSCPPAKGQNYVLNNHPEWQRTPDSSRLRRWYSGIVRMLVSEGTVLRSTILHDAHFGGQRPFVATRRRSHEDNSPRSSGRVRMTVPFFEGDHWPDQAEVIIRELEGDNAASEILGDGDMRQWWQQTLRRFKKSPKEARFDAGGHDVPTPAKRLHWLLSNVASRIANMSKEFLVLYLVEECHRCGLAMRSGSYWGCVSRSCGYCVCNKCLPEVVRWTWGNSEKQSLASQHSHRLVHKEVKVSPRCCTAKEIASCPPSPASSPLAPPLSVPNSPVRTDVVLESPSSDTGSNSEDQTPNTLKDAAGQLSPLSPLNKLSQLSMPNTSELDATIDTETLMPPTIFDQRLDFLWFCQHEACQFDELRRAKFATKKILTRLFDVKGNMDVESS